MKKIWKKGLALGSMGIAMIGALCACSQFRPQLDPTIKDVEGAQFIGSESCIECHDELGQKFQRNIHNLLAEFEYKANEVKARGCEACHGPASLHIEEGDIDNIRQFGKFNAAQVSAICQTCHTDDDTMEWKHSTHAAYGLGCSDCHTIHGNSDSKGMKTERQDELCYSCHGKIRAQMHMPNHHPVKEEKMYCNDCHNPHGSQTRPMLRTDERKNELCLTCHMDYSGPFAFEHAPVTEDCTICHSPHGTVADNLLKQNEPFLCLQCHELHFHTNFRPNTDALEQYAAQGIPGAQEILDQSKGSGMPDNHAMQMAMMTRCSQCHPKVHGSDLPSLYTPGGGSRLTR